MKRYIINSKLVNGISDVTIKQVIDDLKKRLDLNFTASIAYIEDRDEYVVTVNLGNMQEKLTVSSYGNSYYSVESNILDVLRRLENS